MPPSSVQRLGDYLLIERIGEGGMAEVFRAQYSGPAHQSGPTGAVVVKRIRPELFSQPEFPIFREMFLNEAKLVKRLSHKNLARVFALCEARDEATGVTVPFIVGEFVKGRELWALMRTATGGFSGGAVPAGVAAYLIREVALGLGHAHAHQDGPRPQPIIHRDVSPENIMITDEGEVKVIDFGVAKALGGLGPQTRTGIIKGKLAYMAPEQVTQRPVPATDVFGAGIVLHELLTGRRLFGGRNEFLVVQRVLKAPIPPPSHWVAVPRELDEIVMRALDRDLRRRYPDGNSLAAALSLVLKRLPGMAEGGQAALSAWVREIESGGMEEKGRSPEQESDLHVDVDQAIRAVEEAHGQTISLSHADLIFGPIEGTVDPGVHAAVTQAMTTLTPDMLPGRHDRPTARPLAAPALPGMPRQGGPRVPVPAPMSPWQLNQGPAYPPQPLPVPHRSSGPQQRPVLPDRHATVTMPLPRWAKLVMATLTTLVILLLLIIFLR